MLYLYLAGKILLAVLSVFGGFVLFRCLYLSYFSGQEALLAISVAADTAFEQVLRLYERARENSFFCGKSRIILLLPHEAEGGELHQRLAAFGAEILFLK